MTKEWFRLAKEVDRLPAKRRKASSGKTTPLKFGKRNDPK